MFGRYYRRARVRRPFFCINLVTIIVLLIILIIQQLSVKPEDEPPREGNSIIFYNKVSRQTKKYQPFFKVQSPQQYTYKTFMEWNRSLCSIQADNRGPHQKIIALSIYGSTSKYTDNAMFSWSVSIIPFLTPLAAEVKELLPAWTIRLYIDFAGSSQAQQDVLRNFSNIDVCDMNDLPMFGSSVLSYLPGKMWRFLPIFDPFVDFVLSRDVDSPIIQRETETLDLWLSKGYERYIFHILRDHKEHNVPILGGLWGAATGRARRRLFDIFYPVLVPSIARKFNGSGDQDFLNVFVWEKVSKHSLAFDSYSCEQYRSRPFPSKRPEGNCFLGCIRPCCFDLTSTEFNKTWMKPCPELCRPANHKDWTYC